MNKILSMSAGGPRVYVSLSEAVAGNAFNVHREELDKLQFVRNVCFRTFPYLRIGERNAIASNCLYLMCLFIVFVFKEMQCENGGGTNYSIGNRINFVEI